MRLARATAGHVPAHARPPRTTVVGPPPARRGGRATRGRRWLPVLVIATIYLVAIAANEWRIRQHVQELRERAPVEVVEPPPSQPAVLAEAG